MMATAKRSTRRGRSHPITKRELVANNPSIADQVVNRFETWRRLALIFTSLAAAGFVIYNGYFFLGGRAVITDYTLDKALATQNTLIDGKITTVKIDVGKNVSDAKTEINGNLKAVTDTLATVAKSQLASALDQADLSMRLAYTQKQSLQGQLAVVNQALVKDPNDQLANTRKMQLEDFIHQNDLQMTAAQTKMEHLRNGTP